MVQAQDVEAVVQAAEQGDAKAQNDLGLMYLEGRGVTQDETEAANWFRKAAEQGYVDAQHKLGWMYEWGQGVLEDRAEAATWYRKAAEQGDAVAQYKLGWMYAAAAVKTPPWIMIALKRRSGITRLRSREMFTHNPSSDGCMATAKASPGMTPKRRRGIARLRSKAMRMPITALDSCMKKVEV